MSRFVRASKYRHVFGTGTKKEFCFDNVKPSRNAWDSNLLKANPRFVGACWEASGGGAFLVVKQEDTGKLPAQPPLFQGHKAAVLDLDFHPFNDYIVASCSEDCKVRKLFYDFSLKKFFFSIWKKKTNKMKSFFFPFSFFSLFII